VEQRTLIEAFSPPGSPENVYEVFRIRPVVVDSSFLLPDLFWTTRNLTQSTFLDSIDFGVLRPFAAHHIWAEIPRKIAENRFTIWVRPDSGRSHLVERVRAPYPIRGCW
jgi:hypothetical protein